VLAVAPWNFLSEHRIAAAAVDAPHAVKEENQKSPERYELEASLGKLIVTGRRLMAARTDGPRASARPHGNFDTLLVRAEAGVLIDETRETVTPV
jgi:hypothetical protein